MWLAQPVAATKAATFELQAAGKWEMGNGKQNK